MEKIGNQSQEAKQMPEITTSQRSISVNGKLQNIGQNIVIKIQVLNSLKVLELVLARDID